MSLSLGLLNVFSWLDSDYAFFIGIYQKCFCIHLSAHVKMGMMSFVSKNDTNFNQMVQLMLRSLKIYKGFYKKNNW